uniref:Uncharacterized protein n=1 Tax=Panagrolaimus sp. ES5 TaxID=591445 RepID=A0AC34GI80_9BILA
MSPEEEPNPEELTFDQKIVFVGSKFTDAQIEKFKA